MAIKDKVKQIKISVTFKDNNTEMELYEWIKQKGEIVGLAGAIKTILHESMIKEKEGK